MEKEIAVYFRLKHITYDHHLLLYYLFLFISFVGAVGVSRRRNMTKIKRKRVIKTCAYCYHHKLKCDRNNPCSTCIRTKSECIYYFQQLSKDDETSALKTSKPEIEHNNKTTTNDNKVTKKRKIKNNIKVKFKSSANNVPIYYSRAFYPYLEPSLNRMFLFKLSDINEHGLLSHEDPNILIDGPNSYLNYTREELVNEYPKKEYCDNIIHLYWEYVHPLIPVVDKDSTVERYSKFWEEFYDPVNPQFDIDSGILFLAMIYSIKKAFEVNEKDPEILKKIKKEKNDVYNTFEKFKLAFNLISNASFAFIQASIIFYQCGYIYYVGIFPYTASLARQAEFMGLHRDPILHNVHQKKIDIKDAELRRISWNFIRFLDTATSITAGMSPHMIMTNSSTRFPSKYDYNPETGRFDGDVNPFMLFHITRFKCSLVMETISHYLNSDFSSDEEKIIRWEGISQTVTALYQDINVLIQEIFDCSNNPKYSKILLRWLVSNTIVIVHRTYLLHLACDRRPYSHQNRVIMKPLNKPDIGFTKLSQATTNKEFFEQILTIRMPYSGLGVEVCTLLLYETKIRVRMSPELNKFKWFARASNPFQYVFFVLRDIYHFPTKVYDFKDLPIEIQNSIHDDEILNCKEEVRKYAVDVSISSLYRLKDQWPARVCDMMEFLVELRKFVYKSVEDRTKLFSKTNFEAEEFNFIDSTFELDKYRSIYNIISGLNSDRSPFSLNSTGSNNDQFSKETRDFSNKESSLDDVSVTKYELINETHDTFLNNVNNQPTMNDYITYKNTSLQHQRDPILQNLSSQDTRQTSPTFSTYYGKTSNTIGSNGVISSLPLIQKMQPTIPIISQPNVTKSLGNVNASPSPSIYSDQMLQQSLPSIQTSSSYMQSFSSFSSSTNNALGKYVNNNRSFEIGRKDKDIYDSTISIHTPNISNTRTISLNNGSLPNTTNLENEDLDKQ